MDNKTVIIEGKEFRFIPGASRYCVSAFGEVYSTVCARILKPAAVKGYPKLSLSIDVPDGQRARRKTTGVHQLVAQAWIPNPEGKYSVNHIDGNKDNNHISNLEWATQTEQIQHAYAAGLNVAKTGAAHHRFGRRGERRTAETKSKMSAAKLGVKHPLFKGYYHTPFGVFASSFEAAAAAGVAHQTVRKHCHSKHPNWANWFISPNA